MEDETHFFFDCIINKNLRELYFQKLNLDSSLAVEEKLAQILNPKNDEQVKLLGSFLKQSMGLRTGGI